MARPRLALPTTLFLFVALALPPLASAGTVEDPEVTDPAGDHTGGVSQDPFLGLDIRYIFFSDPDPVCKENAVRVQMGLGNLLADDQGNPGIVFSKSVYFAVNGIAYRTYLRGAVNGNTGGDPSKPWIYMYDITNAPDARIPIAGGVDNASGKEFVWWCVPYEKIKAKPGDVVTKIWGRTYLDNYGATDLAPNEAPNKVGRDYVLGGVVPVRANLTVTPAEVREYTVVENESVEIPLNVTNFAAANDTVAFQIEGVTDGWNATPPANVTVAPGETAVMSVSVSPGPGTAGSRGSAAVRYTSSLGANGTVEVSATAESPPPPTAPTASEPAPAASPSEEVRASPESADTPGFDAGVLLSLALAAAWTVRRRSGSG